MSGPWWDASPRSSDVLTHDGSAGAPVCGRCFDEPPAWDEGTNDEPPVDGVAEYPSRIGP